MQDDGPDDAAGAPLDSGTRKRPVNGMESDRVRWRRVNDLFHQALKRAAAERASFLAEMCGDDPDLRAEVESLIASHDRAGSFIEAPAYELAPHLLSEETDMGSLEGAQIGPYRIVQELGRGGMGVVYLADDTRLARKVVVKALAPQIAGDPASRERLRREARAAAALSHPGIATVHALEEVGDDLFIVSEYVRGRTLRDVLRDGPLAPGPLLHAAVGVASALAAAHAQGIVHRDLKPENVMRCADGAIKVLDFGLARFDTEAASSGDQPTFQTETGTILGTPSYMSPEQLEGRRPDYRSDLFSFGVMLYELAAGVHPFHGNSPASTSARILTAEPAPLASLQVPCGGLLDPVVFKCLRKSRDDRYQATTDLVRDLEQIRQDVDRQAAGVVADLSSPVASGRASIRARRWWRFHQVTVSVLYGVMAYPVWQVKEWIGDPWGVALFFGTAVGAALNATLRLHMLFTADVYPESLAEQMASSRRWIVWSDWLLTVLLAASALAIVRTHAATAALIAAIAIIGAVTFLVIEPATTRAALGIRNGSRRP